MQETDIDPRYTHFIQHTVRTRLVYSLQDREDFFAECPSEEYYDELGQPIAVWCFWNSETDALACQQEEWENFALATFSLDEFMNEILLDMDADAKLVGVAFDKDLFGTEIEPIDLLSDLLDEITAQGLTHEFEQFDELQRYRQEWLAAMDTPTIIH
ncbi:DUF2750 domain-containing protein [Wielerella bovis]|uniref:DUF2750 domain-containing protein n=1 Tax=Wielerella bovis TaxID=2917790 RepID=UPI00201A11AA|nr:DUF2750 domain-containing protein [Wielerella bovis]MCG7656448.1 DUF2750 domain-containing protein [Wielerella bovis]MCG7658673.1 DUF2750 domain-containing protein [Wielerella bovis]ULJ60829.1 DUF2750 domain-containing protein [Wielerella bovis]ULJ62961.1 DUF2750 domain-containing protein [Wielerella bovis]ULJ65192.1 DUF2750 domain-containing protein [Wielerella bovis]